MGAAPLPDNKAAGSNGGIGNNLCSGFEVSGAPSISCSKFVKKSGPFPRYANASRLTGECGGQGNRANGYLLKGPISNRFHCRDSLRAASAIFFDELAANCPGASRQVALGWSTVSGGHTRLRFGHSGNAGILATMPWADVRNAILTKGRQVRKCRGRVTFRSSLLMRLFRR
jgi:hypothetical protein